MISPQFYKSKFNTAKVFLGGKRKHFLHKEPDIVVEHYSFSLRHGDTPYSLAHQIFGDGNTRYWTTLMDANSLRMVDDWQKEDVVELPLKVVFEGDKVLR